MSQPDLSDYIPVAERIAKFIEKYPDGCLQAEIIELSDSRIVMLARAFRIPDDTRPGIGYSSLEIPGRTPYTRGSEIENCETSAWGRAIAALGIETRRGIATAEEVRNKAPEAPPTRAASSPALPAHTERVVWGRAIAALGETRRGIATAEEVRNKAPEAPPTRAASSPALPAHTERVVAERHSEEPEAVRAAFAAFGDEIEQPPLELGVFREGEVHLTGHKPLRLRANGALYCPTKIGDDWCTFVQEPLAAVR